MTSNLTKSLSCLSLFFFRPAHSIANITIYMGLNFVWQRWTMDMHLDMHVPDDASTRTEESCGSPIVPANGGFYIISNSKVSSMEPSSYGFVELCVSKQRSFGGVAWKLA